MATSMNEDNTEHTQDEWADKFDDGEPQSTARLVSQFMFAMAYYHKRMRIHIGLHPIFFLAGFLSCYFLIN